MMPPMNYPIWELPGISGGLIIALVSVIHVFVAQFAVGGGFFLVAAERRALRLGSPALMDWTRGHTRFFLLLTMVFGGLTGVAIWGSITVVTPRATGFLISNFFYAWAGEWTFFLGEILALLVYDYTFPTAMEGRMSAGTHQRIGMIYAAFAFMSLFLINSVITFMLTPGGWIQTGEFWDAFFNPSFFPSLFYRFSLSLLLAGLFGLLFSLRIKDPETREKTVRWCALNWVLLPFLALCATAVWYFYALPPELREIILTRHTRDLHPMVTGFALLTPLLLPAALIVLVRAPNGVRYPLAALVVLLALGQYGAFEGVRETARRPWVVHNVMYSNGIMASEVEGINKTGALKAKGGWFRHPEINDANRLEAGYYLYSMQCSACHGLESPRLPLAAKVRGRGQTGVEALISGVGKRSDYMPPFVGTGEEKTALAAYLVWMSARGSSAGGETHPGNGGKEAAHE